MNYPKTTYRELSEKDKKALEKYSLYSQTDFRDYLKEKFDITLTHPTISILFKKKLVSPSTYKKLIKAWILEDPLELGEK